MADDESYQDEDFGPPPAPTIPPEFAHEWLDVAHPESLSAVETVFMSRLQHIAVQLHHLMGQVEDMRIANARAQSRRGSMSSAAASTDGGGDTGVVPIPSDRVQEAFSELRTGELQKILTALHDPFVTVNKKKLYVQRIINANTDARTFIEHITEVIKEKQVNPEGQEADVAEHDERMLCYLDNMTPALKTDLYIQLNKAKKKRDNPKVKAKHAESPILIDTNDSIIKALPPVGLAPRELGGRTVLAPRPARPCRQTSNSSQGNEQPRRYPSRQTSRSSRVEGQSQQSQLSLTSVQARRSKQRTLFVIGYYEDDDGACPCLNT
ncbi:hypothetical protein CEP54_007921 [Fusarium duplospermum]|uniref:Uncharacterized protein n=1 Tax=Fusarium duplospermum TaxID=1325734 RepID=A0A428PYL7_9HYPO|nr:hypothetical protein CEP54_007921 [Fusarium duplospermum]